MDTAATDNPVKIMVLCTGNSCRSQMAEGFLRAMGKGKVEAYSAGLMAAGVHPLAAAVMREAGIDISRQTSDAIDPELLRTMDLVITVCDNAAEACPTTPPGVRRIHMPIHDPVGTSGTKKKMDAFRTARDEIRQAMKKILRLEVDK
jgi:arsenate reductase